MKSVFSYLCVLTLLLGMAWNARAVSTSFTTYEIHLQNSLQQTGSSSFVVGYGTLGIPQFSLVASVDTGGANLSAAPILGLPATSNDFPTGSITFPTGPNFSPIWHTGNGYNRYQWGLGYPTAAELNAAFGSGTFTFTLGNATARPTLSLNTVNPTYPISPTVTSGGTWIGGNLVIDATAGAVVTFNTSSFTDYSSGKWLGAQIKFMLVDSNVMPISPPAISLYIPGYQTDPALTSYTIAPGTLVAGQTYNLQANYNVYSEINTTSFTGTGITGNPAGLSGYLTSTFITIQTTGSNSGNLANISTRAVVQTGDNVMIGGIIVQGGNRKVIIRAVGPSLTAFGVSGALADPFLELHNSTPGSPPIATNDNWQTTIIKGIITGDQVAAIQNSGFAPTSSKESAIIATLSPGNYTAIVKGVNGTTGVGMVEVYTLP
jgi:hypothetical protein